MRIGTMTMNKAIKIAIIPARGGSKRFPEKNIAFFNGKPLITYPIRAALDSKIFDQVLVSTDNNKIRKMAEMSGAITVKRSYESSTDTAHELDACSEYFDLLQKQKKRLPKFFCVLYPTAIFVSPNDLKKSFKLLCSKSSIDVVMGVSKYNYHPFKALSQNKKGELKVAFPEKCFARSQGYTDMFASNGTLYWHKTKRFLAKKYIGHYGNNLVGYFMDSLFSVDIDYKSDLESLIKLYKLYNK